MDKFDQSLESKRNPLKPDRYLRRRLPTLFSYWSNISLHLFVSFIQNLNFEHFKLVKNELSLVGCSLGSPSLQNFLSFHFPSLSEPSLTKHLSGHFIPEIEAPE